MGIDLTARSALLVGAESRLNDALCSALAETSHRVRRIETTEGSCTLRDEAGRVAGHGTDPVQLMRRLRDDGAVLDTLILVDHSTVEPAQVRDLGDTDLAEIFERAVFMPLRCIREAIRVMIPRGKGTILVVTTDDHASSISGTAGARACSRALSGLLEVAAHEVGRDGVTLNSLRVGAGTDAATGVDPDIGYRATAALAALLASPRGSGMTGLTLNIPEQAPAYDRPAVGS